MQEPSSLSVIIPTKNREADLGITIESLLRQTRLPDEIVLVDQSPEKSFTKPIAIPMQYIHEPSLSGLTAARNAGMSVAKGDIWLFLDDDVILEENFIEELVAGYRTGATGISGIITNYEKPPLARMLWELTFVHGSFLDDRQRIYWNALRLQDGSLMRVRQFGGGLMSFRADSIRQLPFDTSLTGACPGEDIEFCARLPRKSVLLIAPRARLIHKRSPAGRTSTHWLYLHAQVNTYMRERHWRSGLWNNLCFLWLNVGYIFAASLSALKRRSFAPWGAWRGGSRAGAEIAARNHLGG